MVQMHEEDAASCARDRRQPLDRLGNQRMRDVGDRAAGNLVGREERAVHERRQRGIGEIVLQPAVPPLPLVDVREPEDLPVRAADQKGHRVRVLVAVRDGDRRDAQGGRQRDLDPGLELPNGDVALRDEPAPREVVAQEPRHRRRAVHRDPARAEDLAAELRQPQVVSDVGMGQENAVGRTPEPVHLCGEVGCCVHEEALARGRVDQAERCDEDALGRRAPRLDAEGLAAARVGHAAVLGDAEDHGLEARSLH